MDERLLMSAYRPNAAVSYFSKMPTFGRTTNITSLISDFNSESFEDYSRGLSFIPLLCLIALVVWLVVLLVCKFILGTKAGVFAGYPYIDESNRISKRRCVPIFVSVSALVIACLGVTFLVKGAGSAQTVFDDIRDGANGIKEVESLVVTSTKRAIALGESTLPLKENLIMLIEEGICNPPDSDSQDLADSINAQAQELLDTLIDLQNFSKNDLTSIQSSFDENVRGFSDNLLEAAAKGKENSKPIYAAAPIVAFGLILGIGGLLASRVSGCGTYFCVQTWLLLPIFFLMVLVAAILTAGSSAVLKFSADICLGGDNKNPEGTVQDLLIQQGVNGVTLDAANYYVVNSCEGDFLQLTEVNDLVSNLDSSIIALNALRDLLSSDTTIAEQCGLDEQKFSDIQVAVDDIVDAFADFIDIAGEAQKALDCQRINSVFVDLGHEAICGSAPRTFLWIYITMSIVFVLGMFIILLRGALLPPVSTSTRPYEHVHSYDQEDAPGSIPQSKG